MRRNQPLASSADKVIQEMRKPESDSLSGFMFLKMNVKIISPNLIWSRSHKKLLRFRGNDMHKNRDLKGEERI
ncbi:hypothetical protein BS630_20395 [Rhizobium laguerreae]|nr:hypothetical protein BS630_20395 [Rhizobium laguerreae]